MNSYAFKIHFRFLIGYSNKWKQISTMLRHLFGEMHVRLWYIFLGVCLNKMYCAFSFSNWLIFGSIKAQEYSKSLHESIFFQVQFIFNISISLVYKRFSQAI